jgi:hypothetical protein
MCDFESGLGACGLEVGGGQLLWLVGEGETPSTFARTGPYGDYSETGLGKWQTGVCV